ncbi:MAG: membrane protein insertase YidC [Planctomycetaceae bacterium]
MDQKRFLLFIVLSMGILIGWNSVVAPWLGWGRPAKKPVANNEVARQNQPADEDVAAAPGKLDAAVGAAETDKSPAEPEMAAEAEPKADGPLAGDAAPPAAPKFPEKKVELGSLEFSEEAGYRQLVTLTSKGAAVESIQLSDPRYRALSKPHPQLEVVGNGIIPRTLETALPQLSTRATSANWKTVDLEPAAPPHHAVTFRWQSDQVSVSKRYELGKKEPQGPEAPAYLLKLDLTFENLSDKRHVVNYLLQGPTGLPLENVDNTQKYRDIVVGFVDRPGRPDHNFLTAATIADGKAEVWTTPFDYLGVDVQYFAALLLPEGDQHDHRYANSVTQTMLGPPNKNQTDISVEVTSVDLELAPRNDAAGKHSIKHTWNLFAGPKRDDVLPPGTDQVIDYGWFAFISRPLLQLLKIFHAVTGSWGIAIICLTIVVRGAMFPLSIKQAKGAAKMQELQPELAALKEKYGKDKEKFARAQMELFSKHKYNPLAGCLPIFLQLPVFMGLYQALNHAVDLRMAKFLWIQNLAAPDALFPLGFALPFLGWKEFNLLPFITIALFIVQQKMFMPPPANDEQAMQQKMMNYMMVFMGVMFYKVPAGLCVYFIASSLWGLAERKLLPKAKPRAAGPADSGDDEGDRRQPPDGGDRGNKGRKRAEEGNGDRGTGFWSMLLKAAEKETSARRASPGKRK